MNWILAIGVLGGFVTVFGAAWPDKKNHTPVYSLKNWLFAIGALILLLYAVADYFYATGSFFFVLLELLVILASFMMMIDVRDKIDAIVLSTAGLGFVIWSLTLYEDYSTILFIIGLTGVSFGYAFKMGSLQRSAALTAGSALLAVFSYIVANLVFFWLNIFFFLFAGYYLLRTILRR